MRILLVLILIFLSGCSDNYNESRELPTKYPETPTMGSAEDATKEIYKK
jgi:hypothetical protein